MENWLLNNINWTEGRQGSGYKKKLLFGSKLLKFDCYLLFYTVGDYIDKHIDPVDYGYEHHRVNINLLRAKKGGKFFLTNGNAYNNYSAYDDFIIKFRPDIQEHGVYKVEEGYRLVLSFGWLKKVIKEHRKWFRNLW